MRWTNQDLADYRARQEARCHKVRRVMQKNTLNPTVRVPSRVEATTDKVAFIQTGENPIIGSVTTRTGDDYRLIVVPGAPVPKPRQTQRDKWQKRPCVLRYREWADRARKIAGELPLKPRKLTIVAYFPFPESWSVYKRGQLRGQPHRQRGDTDNVLKAVGDALYPKGDEMIHHMSADKRWDDGRGARVEITIY